MVGKVAANDENVCLARNVGEEFPVLAFGVATIVEIAGRSDPQRSVVIWHRTDVSGETRILRVFAAQL